ncbi:Sodium channel protein Nach [Eumeta japonica]|uniref:Sodium channel protein Nach n=1 Tax=Eumeta variegata TaxID=151549 RepID=A0A4C1TFV2_EUMVA|nr:Sodium channel protein Nach [Eumeta japonica]
MVHPGDRWWAYRPHKKLSKEIIFRRSMKKVFKEYMKHSSLPGCRYIVDPLWSKKEKMLRLLWLVMVMFIFGYALRTTWHDILGKPLIVSMESTVYAIENVDFPAVALCNVNRISRKASKQLAEELFPVGNYSLDQIEKYLYDLGRLIDFEIQENSNMLQFFEQLPENVPTELWIERMKNLAPKCTDLLIRCRWAGKVQQCNELFALRRTSHGHCCVFNYLLNYNSLGVPGHMEREAERQKIPGVEFGLSVVMDPQVHDYGYRLHNAEGVDVLFYSPFYFADHNNGPLIHHVAVSNTELYLELHSRVQLATEEVRKYPSSTIGQRERSLVKRKRKHE